MLTSHQRKIFTKCAHEISLTALHGYFELSKTADKLNAYNTLLEPPATIRQANAERVTKLFKQTSELWDLYEKAHKAADYVTARPTIYSYSSGNGTFIVPGLLPNFERAPEDETQALAAVDACHAREAQSA